ncbi:hypothetical protein [Pontimicrobium sp. IMCC45349]|uniref:hypothetical protein n=1 Tax=Pontimicrobium sp. IMCC45349 TaxID=3391574 RepID=UPI0039A3019D
MNLKKLSVLLFVFLSVSFIGFAQEENSQKVIANNKVKEAFIKYSNNSSSSSCRSIVKKYDKKGNEIEFNMQRLGSIYKTVYNDQNDKILHLRIEKNDTTKVDSLFYAYDKFHQLILVNGEKFENTYNDNNQLIRQANVVIGDNGFIYKKTIEKSWTPFNQIKTDLETLEKIKEVDGRTAYSNLKLTCKEYQYDSEENLISEVHYVDDIAMKSILFEYDSLNRLVEKKVKETVRTFDNTEYIEEFTTKLSYNRNGKISKKYNYFSDPCMSVEGHFLFKHQYHSNGLLRKVQAFEGNNLVFVITYKYEYYE